MSPSLRSRIFAHLQANPTGRFSIPDLASIFGVTETQARNAIHSLRAKDLIQPHRTQGRANPDTYSIPREDGVASLFRATVGAMTPWHEESHP